MARGPAASETLRTARRALGGRHGVRVSGELLWDERGSNWALPLELTLEGDAGNGVTKVTNWFMLVSARYPWGEIDIYPAKAGGITGTYHHQNHNSEGDANRPWRDGDVCIKAFTFALGRAGNDPDPKGQPDRLVWYVDRLAEWVTRAAAGELVCAGDPFELPHFRVTGGTVGFCEDGDAFAKWLCVPARSGTAELVAFGSPFPLVVRRFLAIDGKELVAPKWGRHAEASKTSVRAAWVRLPRMPILPPYGAPMRWGELREAIAKEGGSLDDLLRPVLRLVRSGDPRLLLVGFPIPRVLGGPDVAMHWQPAFLKDLSSDSNPGFRSNDASRWQRDRMLPLADSRKIVWLQGRNWTASELSRRGQLAASLRSRHVLLIGAGAIGSAVAELLVRGGVTSLGVVDDDFFEAGNLVRHTLTLASVAESKAEALAARLNLLSPHAQVSAACAKYPYLSTAELKRLDDCCDLVIDCSGEDEVIQAIAERERSVPVSFASVSLGRGAARGYLYMHRATRFPADQFWELLAPHLARDRADFPDAELPWEGIGCSHPVFPARAIEVWSLATEAVRAIEQWCERAWTEGGLSVLQLPVGTSEGFGITAPTTAA